VGNQSTGKSTLLEAICGDVLSLPKGHGMVTRSPVQLSLRNNAKPGEMNCVMEVSHFPIPQPPEETGCWKDAYIPRNAFLFNPCSLGEAVGVQSMENSVLRGKI